MVYEFLAVGLGGFLGAIIRFVVSARLNKEILPFGTLLVNSAGSFLIGYVFGLEMSPTWTLFWTAGLAGALTTYSTLMKEIWTCWMEDRKGRAVIYTAVTFGLGIGLTFIGYSL